MLVADGVVDGLTVVTAMPCGGDEGRGDAELDIVEGVVAVRTEFAVGVGSGVVFNGEDGLVVSVKNEELIFAVGIGVLLGLALRGRD